MDLYENLKDFFCHELNDDEAKNCVICFVDFIMKMYGQDITFTKAYESSLDRTGWNGTYLSCRHAYNTMASKFSFIENFYKECSWLFYGANTCVDIDIKPSGYRVKYVFDTIQHWLDGYVYICRCKYHSYLSIVQPLSWLVLTCCSMDGYILLTLYWCKCVMG